MLQRLATMLMILYGLLCVQLASALVITNLTLQQTEMVAHSGSGIMIPCSFSINNPTELPKSMFVAWEFTPEDSDISTPVLILYATREEQMVTPNERAHMFESLLIAGNCSLVIDPVYLNDSGTYGVRVIADEVPFIGSLNATLKVLPEELHENFTDDDIKEQMESKEVKSRARRPDNGDVLTPDYFPLVKLYQQLKKGSRINLLLVSYGLPIIIVIAVIVLGIYFGYRYFKLRKMVKDDVSRMEEGELNDNSHSTSGHCCCLDLLC